ncbi:hypothetical protein G7K_3912-t1 [Saitoella complicata NRRL Y-17804]|uniref:Uncharacterized protein n=1 Tax=Saitoella complicata (strain BCRC 22490 / CBS 7301 / JCM 7358 / NBRC 10748 / NRRL Y-17804) TaxID=698492 RepID=A0A0E9NK41_SAICN|nr:hypothetical protein G7K_3912-t1 [Saitoella complicata NRRL Y-17804]
MTKASTVVTLPCADIVRELTGVSPNKRFAIPFVETYGINFHGVLPSGATIARTVTRWSVSTGQEVVPARIKNPVADRTTIASVPNHDSSVQSLRVAKFEFQPDLWL